MRPDPRLRAAAAVLALLTTLLLPGCGPSSQPAAPAASTEDLARGAARAFLSRYVDPDGRVVRRDQGGDTVSEGQAYALLLAEVAGDRATGDRVWSWSRQRLQRPDGLLSYLADASGVRDPQAAGDADLLSAWALVRDAEPDGTPLAAATRQHETVAVGPRRLLAAGPWATGRPATLNPSYWTPAAYRELARRTGQPAWASMAEDAVSTTSVLTSGGRTLPPDWARADGDRVRASPAPDGHVPVPRYSLDAERVVVWMATDCSPAARRLAAAWYPLLTRGDPAATARGLDGTVLDAARQPLPLVAAAAAAAAAGQAMDRDRLLDEAAALERTTPTYYGAAWVALGRTLLQTHLLDACEERP